MLRNRSATELVGPEVQASGLLSVDNRRLKSGV